MNARVERIVEWSPSVRSIFFRPERSIRFVPGQFLMVSVPHAAHKRAYSIASSPADEVIEIAVKKAEGGKLSPLLFELKEGDEILCEGPFGNFRLDPAARRMVLVAGGTGIAPLMSMLRSMSAAGWPAKVTVVYGAFDARSLLYLDELRSYGNCVDVRLVVENAHDGWDGREGRISKEMLADVCEPGIIFYLCGPPAMIRAVEEMLVDLGVGRDAIRTDKWD